MRRIVQSVGAVVAVIALILVIISISTSNWLRIEVNSIGLRDKGLAGYSRVRGLYQECWIDDAAKAAIASNKMISSESCLYLDLSPSDRPTEYQTRSGLLISMWVILGFTALFVLMALILYLYTLCQHVNNYQWKYGTKASAGLTLAAALFNGLAMGLYHGADYVELNKVRDPSGEHAPYPYYFTQDLPTDLFQQTTRLYSWSYALCWCALACELLASVLFMTISCCYVKSAKKKSVFTKPPPKQTTLVVPSRSPSYEMVNEKVVVAPPQVYVVGDDYYEGRNGTYDPYRNGQPNNAYSPSFDYDRGWMVE